MLAQVSRRPVSNINLYQESGIRKDFLIKIPWVYDIKFKAELFSSPERQVRLT